MKLPQYSGKDYIIMLWTMGPFTVLLNSIIFGARYYTQWDIFTGATVVTFLFLVVSFILYGGVAVAFRNRFPHDSMFFKRTAIVIGLFIIMTGLLIFLLFKIYASIPFFQFNFYDASFTGAYSATVVLNVFLTILHEGVAKFQHYKATLIETEQLKKEYLHSQLLGLKSQVNPHFLFNGLNSLSSLIGEDPEKAEKFLDEMSKVYRYLLRNEEDQLVTLETEIQFIQSWYYLLKVRYSDGVKLTLALSNEQKKMWLPPLTLQILFECAFNLNTVSKDQPLEIEIRTIDNGWLEVSNTIRPKAGTERNDCREGLENIINKFRLLCQQTVTIDDSETHRVVRLPLLTKETISLV